MKERKYRVVIESFARKNDLRVYNIRNVVTDESFIIKKVNEIEGVVSRIKPPHPGFMVLMPESKRFYFQVIKATAYDWDEIEPSILSAIAIVEYGCTVDQLEVIHRTVGDDGEQIEDAPTPDPVGVDS